MITVLLLFCQFGSFYNIFFFLFRFHILYSCWPHSFAHKQSVRGAHIKTTIKIMKEKTLRKIIANATTISHNFKVQKAFDGFNNFQNNVCLWTPRYSTWTEHRAHNILCAINEKVVACSNTHNTNTGTGRPNAKPYYFLFFLSPFFRLKTICGHLTAVSLETRSSSHTLVAEVMAYHFIF